MTKEKVIEILNELWRFERTDKYSDKEIRNALELSIEALEKQIPKKPKNIDHWHLCPSCYEQYGFSYDILVGSGSIGLKSNECHCSNCGQLIDLDLSEGKI